MRLMTFCLVWMMGCAASRGGPEPTDTALIDPTHCSSPRTGLRDTLCQREVFATVQKQVPLLQDCISDNVSAATMEKVLVSYSIEPDGHIDDIGIQDESLETDDVLACARQALASWTFEKSHYGVAEVKFPVRVVARREGLSFDDVFGAASQEAASQPELTFEDIDLGSSDDDDGLELGAPQISGPKLAQPMEFD